MDIPSTSVVRHWIAWSYTQDTPDEFIEHGIERVLQFEAWLQQELDKSFAQGVLAGRDHEQERIVAVLDAERARRHDAGVLELLGFDTAKTLIKGEQQ